MGSLATKNTKSTEAWPKVRLGEVCEISAGDSAPQDKRLYENGKYPFIRTSDVGDIHFGVITDSRDHLNDAGVKKLRVFPKGSILFPKSGASTFLNHRVMLGIDARVVSHLAVIIPREKLDSKFLLHLLFTVDAKELMQDSGYPSLRAADIAKVEFPLPPLSVQREIVARLEKELASVDRMVKGFEAMKTEADQLFKAELKESFEDIKRRGAETRRLGEASAISYGYTAKARQDDGSGAPKYLRITDIQEKMVDWASVPICDCDDTDYLLKEGDVVFARTGATTGKSFLIRGDIPKSVFASYLIRVRLNKEAKINSEFLWYSFDTPQYWATIQDGMAGAAQGGFNSKKLASLEIPVPPLTTQREVVAKLDAVREKCAKLKSAAEEGLKTAALMRKAILKEAFE